jgi:hypothetical protein
MLRALIHGTFTHGLGIGSSNQGGCDEPDMEKQEVRIPDVKTPLIELRRSD